MLMEFLLDGFKFYFTILNCHTIDDNTVRNSKVDALKQIRKFPLKA